jgi:hypothetical protein
MGSFLDDSRAKAGTDGVRAFFGISERFRGRSRSLRHRFLYIGRRVVENVCVIRDRCKLHGGCLARDLHLYVDIIARSAGFGRSS